jgi:Ca2+-binding RTX toxin-like protein
MATPDPSLSKGFKTMVGTLGSDELWGLAESVEMFGLAGDDFYFVDGDDKVVEDAAAGTDTVTATGLASYTLPDNVENLTLDGTTTGYGNALKNVLIGDAGNNNLSGGAEADDMRGGLGNDVYVRGQRRRQGHGESRRRHRPGEQPHRLHPGLEPGKPAARRHR